MFFYFFGLFINNLFNKTIKMSIITLKLYPIIIISFTKGVIIMPTIGIPRGLLYYRYEYLWKAFFNALNIKYIISGESNLEMLNNGKNKCVDESCLSLKLFVGHVDSIKYKCDYVFIPRLYSIEKKEQVCTNFNCLYDLIHNLYPELKIINYNVDVKHNRTEKDAFLDLGKQLGFNKKQSFMAYKIAKKKEEEHYQKLEIDQEKKLSSHNPKVLLLGHPYNLKDALIGKTITNFFSKYQVEIINGYHIPNRYVNQYAKEISPRVHWTMNKELLASFMYYKDKVDGVILVTAFPCGPDSLTNEMILRKKGKTKVLLLTFEELSSDVAVITRLESFMDMLKGGVLL